MTRTVHGTVHGKTIELDEDLGVAAGQQVEIQIKLVAPARTTASLSGRFHPPATTPDDVIDTIRQIRRESTQASGELAE